MVAIRRCWLISKDLHLWWAVSCLGTHLAQSVQMLILLCTILWVELWLICKWSATSLVATLLLFTMTVCTCSLFSSIVDVDSHCISYICATIFELVSPCIITAPFSCCTESLHWFLPLAHIEPTNIRLLLYYSNTTTVTQLSIVKGRNSSTVTQVCVHTVVCVVISTANSIKM